MRCSVIALTLALLFAAPVFAQKPPGGPPADRRNTDRMRQQDMSSREWQLRNFGNEPRGAKDERQLKALIAQTEEDFNRILTLHNEIARAISSQNDLDYHFVSEATGEIKKRASRVQSNLHLTLEEGQVPAKSEEFNESQMKDALIKLCKEIRSFVTNPSIENPAAINVDQIAKAKLDLESVIQLSGQIKKDSDRIGKTRK